MAIMLKIMIAHDNIYKEKYTHTDIYLYLTHIFTNLNIIEMEKHNVCQSIMY